MVCVPCIVIPFLLWFFNRYIRPIISKFWNPSTEKLEQAKCPFKGSPTDSGGTSTIPADTAEDEVEKINKEQNGVANGQANGVANGHAVTADGDIKKTN